jgi:hypothetical protein
MLNLPGEIVDSLAQIAQEVSGTVAAVALGQEMKEKSLTDLQEDFPAPSSFAKDRDKGCWVSFLHQHPDKILCHRDMAENFSIPMCLLDPVFTEFVYDLDHIAVSSDDWVFVDRLTDSLCGAFDNKKECKYKFFELFQ